MKIFYPWLDWVPDSFWAGVSKLWGLGNLRAPGTWGSAAGFLFCFFALRHAPFWAYAVVCVLLLYVAVGVCGRAQDFFKVRDPGFIILDEFAVMPLCYVFLWAPPAKYLALFYALGFALFRFFDIVKPLGISKIQNLPGGLGVVADDVLAAVYACAVLNAAAFCMERM